MLTLAVRTETPLSMPATPPALVMWLDVTVREVDTRASIGSARAAIVRVSDAMNHGVYVRDVLGDLLPIYEPFFDRNANCLKHEFHNGMGWNLLYFEHVHVSPLWSGRHIEEVIVKRIAEVWGESCAIAVMPISDDATARAWHELGSKVVREPAGGQPGYACFDLSRSWPEIRQADVAGHRFEIGGRQA